MLSPIVRYFATFLLSDEWHVVRIRIEYELEQLRLGFTPPLVAQKLLISGEDHRSSSHNGYDLHAICRAVWRRATRKSIEGASTIEQQIVRVITGQYDRTLSRKFKEILLASLVSHNFPKKELPAVYLQIAYYGWQMNGFLNACYRLGLSPHNICKTDAAGLVARLKYPEPKVMPEKRIGQIEMRKNHLLKLFYKHQGDGTYDHLESPSVCIRQSLNGINRAVPKPGTIY